MEGKNAVFIDLATMNVLFRDGASMKFTLVLNYAGALERLSATLAAMGTGYDLYLCLRPRAAGEGDYVIDDLSMSGVPFVVDAQELHDVIQYFRRSVGVSEIYLCNWLYNYVHQARVSSFESAFFYGTRVAYVAVEEKMVTSFVIYKDAVEFYEARGNDFPGYGDVGLIDVDGFKAQYPEFGEATRNQATSLAPLAHCYKTSCRITTDELFEQLTSFLAGEAVHVEDAGAAEEVAPDVSEPVEVEPEEKPDFSLPPDLPQVRRKVRWSIPTVAIIVVACLLSAALGVCNGYIRRAKIQDNPESYYTSAEERIRGLNNVAAVYQDVLSPDFDVINALEYASNSQLNVVIAGFDRHPDYFVVRYSCVSDSDRDAYIQYIESQYIVTDTKDVGVAEVGGVEGRQYTVQFSERESEA